MTDQPFEEPDERALPVSVSTRRAAKTGSAQGGEERVALPVPPACSHPTHTTPAIRCTD